VTNTIAHELVRYQLMDEGKPLGHGLAFKKMGDPAHETRPAARRYEHHRVAAVHAAQEPECIPHRTEYKNVPLPDVAADISKRLSNAVHLAAKGPGRINETQPSKIS
jgi:hypothetical protein